MPFISPCFVFAPLSCFHSFAFVLPAPFKRISVSIKVKMESNPKATTSHGLTASPFVPLQVTLKLTPKAKQKPWALLVLSAPFYPLSSDQQMCHFHTLDPRDHDWCPVLTSLLQKAQSLWLRGWRNGRERQKLGSCAWKACSCCLPHRAPVNSRRTADRIHWQELEYVRRQTGQSFVTWGLVRKIVKKV